MARSRRKLAPNRITSGTTGSRVAPARKPARRPWLLFAAIGALLLAGVVILAGELIRGGDDPEPLTAVTAQPTAPASGSPDGTPGTPPGQVYPGIPRSGASLGSESAPLVIEEWADFQCPVCKRFYQTIEPLLIRDYVATGKVRLVFRNLAFIGPESTQAARAAGCAAEQERFWEYHNVLFERQGAENSGAFSDGNLTLIADSAGLDPEAFQACFTSDRYESKLEADLAEGNARGITSTPTLVIGDEVVVGLSDYEELKSVIDNALAQ